MKTTLSAFFLTVLLSLSAGAQRGSEAPAPDPAFQARIRAAVEAATPADQAARLDDLETLQGPDARTLVTQLVHYTHAAKTTRDAMAFGALVQTLRIPQGSVLRGTVPFLESGDEDLVLHASGILQVFEGATPDRPADLAPYRSFLEAPLRSGALPPRGLTQHLFRVAPGEALLLFSRLTVPSAEGRKPFLWAEHVLPDLAWRERHGFPTEEVRAAARRELESLVSHSTWWARLAAAAFLEHQPSLAQEAWTERLQSDPHPYVRERALR